jgi:hypothetical protein
VAIPGPWVHFTCSFRCPPGRDRNWPTGLLNMIINKLQVHLYFVVEEACDKYFGYFPSSLGRYRGACISDISYFEYPRLIFETENTFSRVFSRKETFPCSHNFSQSRSCKHAVVFCLLYRFKFLQTQNLGKYVFLCHL